MEIREDSVLIFYGYNITEPASSRNNTFGQEDTDRRGFADNSNYKMEELFKDMQNMLYKHNLAFRVFLIVVYATAFAVGFLAGSFEPIPILSIFMTLLIEPLGKHTSVTVSDFTQIIAQTQPT